MSLFPDLKRGPFQGYIPTYNDDEELVFLEGDRSYCRYVHTGCPVVRGSLREWGRMTKKLIIFSTVAAAIQNYGKPVRLAISQPREKVSSALPLISGHRKKHVRSSR